MRKSIVSICVLLAALVCCGSSVEDRGLSQFVFYASPKEVIAKLDDPARVLSAEEHYMLGNAWLAEKDQKKALLHFANSCFVSKRNLALRLYPQPVHEFVTSFGVKSGCRQDALYNIAQIMYGYRELDYVIRFCMLEDDELLRGDFALLRGKALMAQKKHADAAAFYEKILKEKLPADDRALLLIRLGSCLETLNRKEDAIAAFSRSLEAKPDGWQAPIAGRNLARLGLDNPSAMYGIAPQLCKALIAAGKYDKLLVFTSAFIKDRGVSKGDVLDAHVRALVEKNMAAEIELLVQNNAGLKHDILYAKADRLWKKGQRGAALDNIQRIAPGQSRVRDYAGRSGNYYYDRNKAESDRFMLAYANAGEPEPLAEQYLWLMSKNYISGNNLAGARALLERIVKEYPDGSYAGNARFWLYRLLKEKEPAQAERLARDLVIRNNSSTYCWRLIGELAKTGTADQHLAAYRQALSAGDRDALYFHALLSYVERDAASVERRQKELVSAGMSPVQGLVSVLNSERYISGYGAYCRRLKDYFLLADTAGIRRVLDSLPDDDAAKQDKFAALARYGRQAGHYITAFSAWSGWAVC
jgi:TolA-binding protein